VKIQSVRVGDQTVSGSLRVVVSQPVEVEHFSAPEGGGTKSLLAGVTAGAAAKYSWQGFQATNTLGADEIAKLLVENGLSPQHAPSVAQRALDVIQTEPTKVLLVAVSAGGTAWAAIEAGSKLFGLRVSTWRKLFISVLVATVAGFGYHYLRNRGYLQ